jgi:hypothetical protein
MSRWAEKFAALSCDVDRSDTLRHIADAAPDVSRSVHSITLAPQPGEVATRPDASAEPSAAVEHDDGIPAAWLAGFAGCIPTAHPAMCRRSAG